MESQDVVTYKQKVIRVITEEEIGKIFQDENLLLVLKFLRKGPMTIGDIEKAFKKIRMIKSEKTIYRYLYKLVQAGLVVKAGKRVTSSEDDSLSTQTLYSRTAKVFFENYSKEEKAISEVKRNKNLHNVGRLLIGQLFDNKGSQECFHDLAQKINDLRRALTIELFENASEEALELITDLDWKGINYLFEYVGWIAVSQKIDLNKELELSLIHI